MKLFTFTEIFINNLLTSVSFCGRAFITFSHQDSDFKLFIKEMSTPGSLMISFELTTYAKKHYKTKQAKANQNGGKLLIIYNIIFITFH